MAFYKNLYKILNPILIDDKTIMVRKYEKRHQSDSQTITSPAFTGVKIKSDGKPLSRACCATGEGITFLPLSLPEGGWVTIAAI